MAPIQMSIDEVLPRSRTPVPQQHVLHIGERERTLEQRIVVEVDLTHRQVVGCAPVGVYLVEQFRREGVGFRRHGLQRLHRPTLDRCLYGWVTGARLRFVAVQAMTRLSRHRDGNIGHAARPVYKVYY